MFSNFRRKVKRDFLFLLNSRKDGRYVTEEVPAPRLIPHGRFNAYLSENFDKEGLRVLEVGSRSVTGRSTARERFKKSHYTGFDYYEGHNVDVVGDAHKLSQYFDEPFDLVYSSACFEHFAMPWMVAMEIAKVLKVGGHVAIETHFSFSAHERPWNFFQFSDMGLKVLFNRQMGFECLDAGMSSPMVARFSSHAIERLRFKRVKDLYGHSEYLGRKVAEPSSFDWRDYDVDQVTGGTVYPAKTGYSRLDAD